MLTPPPTHTLLGELIYKKKKRKYEVKLTKLTLKLKSK